MNIRYRVELNEGERAELTATLSGGKHAARKVKRAQILLAADAGIGDEAIARGVSVGESTVYRTKRRFVEGNLELALTEEARPGAARKLSGKETALLVATACSSPAGGPPAAASTATTCRPLSSAILISTSATSRTRTARRPNSGPYESPSTYTRSGTEGSRVSSASEPVRSSRKRSTP